VPQWLVPQWLVPVLVLELGQELVLVWALASVPVSKPVLVLELGQELVLVWALASVPVSKPRVCRCCRLSLRRYM
jgi:hypothetical protein